jgi:hypothetical protein
MKTLPEASFWTKTKDDHLRVFYNDLVKVDPAILAYELRVPGRNKARCVVRRLCELGLRKHCHYP